ncbi:MAG TPA: beta-ketoacyl-ACP synthase III [Alphaproteobacteria bacterium]
MAIRARIAGCGGYLPKQIVTNDDLAKRGIETSDEWIVQRTGIKQRHFAAEGEKTSDLAIEAAKAALAHAGITDLSTIDGVIVATTTPDKTFPATAVFVQAGLGLRSGTFAFDVQAVCSGFIYALAVANNFIISGQYKRMLVIGAETMTRLLNWDDRTTCILFGDGAGAVVLEAVEGTGTIDDQGILSTHLHTDGYNHAILETTGGVSTDQNVGVLTMAGKEVFKHAVHRLAEVVEETLQANHLQKSDLDWLVPHQANKRIIEATGEKLGMSEDQVILTVAEHANTSAASVPLALAHAAQQNKFKKGDLLLLEAMGAGLTWGAALVRW